MRSVQGKLETKNLGEILSQRFSSSLNIFGWI
jgi:hypothetical protein